MKKKELRFYFLIIGLVLIVALAIYLLSKPGIYFDPLEGTTTSISLDPQTAKINKPLTITLTIDHQSPTPFYDIIQFVPNGFLIKYEGISVPRPDLEYLHPNTNPIQFLVFNPSSTTHSYVVIPNPSELCPSAPGTQLPLHGLYLAPPKKPRTPLGSSFIPVQSGEVTRTFSKPETTLNGEITVYLNVYPACSNSYTIQESIPPELTLIDSGEGTLNGGILRWDRNCPGTCPSTVISYKMRGETERETTAVFDGSYSIGNSPPRTTQGSNTITLTEIDCTVAGACGQIACQGEYCNAQQTQSCFNYQCVASCTGREGYYCSSGCNSPDKRYAKGDASCEAGTLCCQDSPSQSCEAAGGYCVFDESPPFLECPSGFTRNSQYDLTCNGGDIPLGRSSYPICCMLSQQTVCFDQDNDGYDTCNPPEGDSFPTDCNDNNPSVNPGSYEGMNLPNTCFDALDNNCDGSIDTQNPAICYNFCPMFYSCKPSAIGCSNEPYPPGNSDCTGQLGESGVCCQPAQCEDLGGFCNQGGCPEGQIIEGNYWCQSRYGQDTFCCSNNQRLTI